MPRLADHLLRSVIYLYASADDAEKGEGTGGSGLIVGQPTRNPDIVFLYAVTNWHVAKNGRPVIRVAGPPGDRVIERVETDWIDHPYGDDVVLTPLEFAPRDSIDYRLGYIPREWFVVPDNFTRAKPKDSRQEPRIWPFGPGDETVLLGRFLGYDGRQGNQPVARFGNLSVGEAVPIRHEKKQLDQESFLVESRSLSGYSGSAVFIYRANTSFFGTVLQVEAPKLLGVDWGHLTASPQKENEYEVSWGGPDQPDPVRYNSGVMVVVPAWRLALLLDSEEVVAIQDREEEKAAK